MRSDGVWGHSFMTLPYNLYLLYLKGTIHEILTIYIFKEIAIGTQFNGRFVHQLLLFASKQTVKTKRKEEAYEKLPWREETSVVPMCDRFVVAA
jgi:hypothetical protein